MYEVEVGPRSRVGSEATHRNFSVLSGNTPGNTVTAPPSDRSEVDPKSPTFQAKKQEQGLVQNPLLVFWELLGDQVLPVRPMHTMSGLP